MNAPAASNPQPLPLHSADELLALLAARGGAIVADAGPSEQAYALAVGCGYVDPGGRTFIWRPPRAQEQSQQEQTRRAPPRRPLPPLEMVVFVGVAQPNSARN